MGDQVSMEGISPRGICQGLDPVESGGSGLRRAWVSLELRVWAGRIMRIGKRFILDPSRLLRLDPSLRLQGR